MFDTHSSKRHGKESSPPSYSSAASPRKSSDENGVPVLDDDNRSFLESLTSWSDADEAAHDRAASGHDPTDAAGSRPPLPPRLKTPDLTWDSDSESFVREDVVNRQAKSRGLAPEKHKKSSGGVVRRLSALLSSGHHDKGAGTVAHVSKDTPLHAPVATHGHGDSQHDAHQHASHLAVPGHADTDSGIVNITDEEERRENADLNKVLDDLDLAMKGGKKGSKGNKIAVALSAESGELVRKFVLVLKDLVNGVPTAADDLRHLLDDRDGTLQRSFDKMPKSLRKLVAQMPTKLTASLGPEILAAAAETQGVKINTQGAGGAPASTKSAAKAALLPLITKPTALVKMLKAIMNALKLRWPAFAGTSAIWSVGLFLLMFVLWYCHKRGREVRLEKEAAGYGHGVPAQGDFSSSSQGHESASHGQLPPPPIGKHASKK